MKDEHKEFLLKAGAGQVSHSGRTLFDHLSGTYELLKSWGNKEVICVAGLFHSVYGTQTFACHLIDRDQRNGVAGVIGVEAERLVFLFCNCDRDCFFENIGSDEILLVDKVQRRLVDVSTDILRALVEIEIANILEQIPHKTKISSEVMRTYVDQCGAARTIISTEACRHMTNVFGCFQ